MLEAIIYIMKKGNLFVYLVKLILVYLKVILKKVLTLIGRNFVKEIC